MALASWAGAPGAAAELTRDVPGPERGVCALAGCAEPGMGAVGFFLRCWLILPRYGILACADPWYPLAGQGDQARGFQLVQHAPDPIGLLFVHSAGQRPGHPHDVPRRAGDDLHVHPVLAVLA